jgi:hypothetical protein
MDDWFDTQTKIFFSVYERDCREYMFNAEPLNTIFEASYTSNQKTGPITYRWDFMGFGASKYVLKNLKTFEENDVRLISHQVLEPRLRALTPLRALFLSFQS